MKPNVLLLLLPLLATDHRSRGSWGQRGPQSGILGGSLQRGWQWGPDPGARGVEAGCHQQTPGLPLGFTSGMGGCD